MAGPVPGAAGTDASATDRRGRFISPQALHQFAAGDGARPGFGQRQQDALWNLLQLQRRARAPGLAAAPVDAQRTDLQQVRLAHAMAPGEGKATGQQLCVVERLD